MGDWMHKLLPWYNPKEQDARIDKTEAQHQEALVEIARSQAVIKAYRVASDQLRNVRNGIHHH